MRNGTSGTADFDKDKYSRISFEKKIILNSFLFRRKLSGTDFEKIDFQKEKKLLEELNSTARGLSAGEVYMLYTLLRSDILLRKRGRALPAGLHPEESIVSSDIEILGQGKIDYGKKLVSLLRANFLAPGSLASVNGGNEIPAAVMEEFLSASGRSREGAAILRAAVLAAGYETAKYEMFARKFLKHASLRGKGSVIKYQAFFASYLLFNICNPEKKYPEVISPSLKNFLNGKPERDAISFFPPAAFAAWFTVLLAGLVLKVSDNFIMQPETRRKKLEKLYGGKKRIEIFERTAANQAMEKIHVSAGAREGKEILRIMKKTCAGEGPLITLPDLFRSRYNF